jgi:long-chain acyl-CoA synthetase
VTLVGPPLEKPVELARILDLGLRTKPNDVALVSLERTWSWQQLDKASTALALHYLALRLVPGDRVASLMPNRGLLLVHYLACLKAGLIATPLNYRYQAPEIDHALEVSGAALLVAHEERGDVVAACKAVARLRLGVIKHNDAVGAKWKLEDLAAVDASTPELPTLQPDQPAFIFFTSGSTGKPKGVTHTHCTFGWMVASTAAGLGLTPDDVFLPATSASHVAAASFALAGLAAGARVAIARTFDGDEILPLLRSIRPTVLCMHPAPLFALVRDHGASKADFASLRRCISGGDKIAAELEREFIELSGKAIEEVYGMTEIGTAAINPTAVGNRIGSIGQLAPGYQASLRDEEGVEVPTGTGSPGNAGRMWIKSRCNMIGYWGRPDATAEIIRNGWLDTGDLVAADEQNYLWFRGRKKQIIIHDGSNICPQEVEDSLLEHPAVESAGVVGIHNLIHGENVRAYIVFRPEFLKSAIEPPTLSDLIEFSRARVGYKAPDEIIVLDQMPINAVGKVDRVALRQLADEAVNQHLG